MTSSTQRQKKRGKTIDLDLISANQRKAKLEPVSIGSTEPKKLSGTALDYLSNLQSKTKSYQNKRQKSSSKTSKDFFDSAKGNRLTLKASENRSAVSVPDPHVSTDYEKFEDFLQQEEITSISSISEEKLTNSADSVIQEQVEIVEDPESSANSVSTCPLGQIHSFSSLSIESDHAYKHKPSAKMPAIRKMEDKVVSEATTIKSAENSETIQTVAEIASDHSYVSDFEEEIDEAESSEVQESSSEVPDEPLSSSKSKTEARLYNNKQSLEINKSASSSSLFIDEKSTKKFLTRETQTDCYSQVRGMRLNALTEYTAPPSLIKDLCLQHYNEMNTVRNPMRQMMVQFLSSQLEFLKSNARFQADLYTKQAQLLDRWLSVSSEISSESTLQKMA